MTYRERAVLVTYLMCRVKELADYHLSLSDLEEIGDDAFNWGFVDEDVVTHITKTLRDGAIAEREFRAEERRKERDEKRIEREAKAAAKSVAKAYKAAGVIPVIEDVAAVSR